MARKPKTPVEIKKNEPVVLRYENYEPCEADFLKKTRKIVDETDFLDLRCNHSVWIENNAIAPLEYFVDRKRKGIDFQAVDLENALNLSAKIGTMFSEKTRYVPNIFTFCRLLGISSQTFSNWTYENTERGEMARIAQDYYRNLLTQTIYSGELHPASGAFIGKATLGMREFDGSTTNINIVSTEKSVADIMAELEKARKDLH